MRLGLPGREQEKHDEFLDVKNAELECLAEITKLKTKKWKELNSFRNNHTIAPEDRRRPFDRRQRPPQSERQSKPRKLRRNWTHSKGDRKLKGGETN